MAQFPSLKVEKRTLIGRKVKQLRREGLIPANIFGKKISSVAVQIDNKTFVKIFEEVGETGIVDVCVGTDKYPSLITGCAVDPVTGSILHVDFHNVSLKEKVTATIPVHLVGEAPAVKDHGGILNQSLHEIEVEALPTDLPEAIEVDVAHLENIGDSITVGDLKVSDKLEIKIDAETIVLVINEPAKEEVVEASVETEIIGETSEQPATETEAAPTKEASEKS
jgi:large subunit ribosomal protein L25